MKKEPIISFGRSGSRLPMKESDVISTIAKINTGLSADKDGAMLSKEIIRKIRKDEALMDFALSVAIGTPPKIWFFGNEHIGSDGCRYKVRTITKSGDIWVDRLAPGEGETWDYQYFKGDILWALCKIHPELKNHDIKTVSGWRRLSLFLLMISEHSSHVQKAPKKEILYCRLGMIKLYAKNPANSVQTRILCGLIWLGAKGKIPMGKASGIIPAILTAAALPADRGRQVHETIKALMPVISKVITLGKPKWRDWIKWVDEISESLLVQNKAARFRVYWASWYSCLSYEDGRWRWRGFHTVRGKNGEKYRPETKIGARLSRIAGVCKKTGTIALTSLTETGHFITAGAQICLGLGLWNKELSEKSKNPVGGLLIQKVWSQIRRNMRHALPLPIPPPPAAV